jgi:pimeloyl-ACP methyl ester carboxylesterase
MLQVVVIGKSLGGAVALHLAADNPTAFKAIVIENTFLSIEDVAPKVRI